MTLLYQVALQESDLLQRQINSMHKKARTLGSSTTSGGSDASTVGELKKALLESEWKLAQRTDELYALKDRLNSHEAEG